MTGDEVKCLDVKSLVERHQEIVLGKNVLYLRKINDEYSERLLVVMSAHNQGVKYMNLRGFLKNQRYDLLFITDPDNTWYLDDDIGCGYLSILSEKIKNYDAKNVFLFGSSMSGYSAILFALKLNLNAISVNPQINLDVSKDYSWDELKFHIDNIPGEHINIDEWCIKNWHDSVVYLMHGHDDIDVVNAKLLLNAMPSRRKVIVQTVGLDCHTMFFGKNVEQIYEIIDLISLYRGVADQEIESGNMTDTLKKKAVRRQSRNEINMFDPYRNINTDNIATWQRRYLYENSGCIVFFTDVGLYGNDGSLSGALCFYDGNEWKLISPKPSKNDNIINDWGFINDVHMQNPKDNELLIGESETATATKHSWWIRNKCSSDIEVKFGYERAKITINKAASSNIYIGLSVNENILQESIFNKIEGKYLTFFADVSSTNGGANLVLGGVSDNNYHHRNSRIHKQVGFSQLVVFEQFFNIDKKHRESIFVRVNLCPDGKAKTIRVKNVMLVLGYYPMGG